MLSRRRKGKRSKDKGESMVAKKSTVEVERVEKFIVNATPQRATLRKIRALRKGKTIFVPLSMVSRWDKKRIADTPAEAKAVALKDAEDGLKDEGSFMANCEKEVANVKALEV
jgi:hypothetical protein